MWQSREVGDNHPAIRTTAPPLITCLFGWVECKLWQGSLAEGSCGLVKRGRFLHMNSTSVLFGTSLPYPPPTKTQVIFSLFSSLLSRPPAFSSLPMESFWYFQRSLRLKRSNLACFALCHLQAFNPSFLRSWKRFVFWKTLSCSLKPLFFADVAGGVFHVKQWESKIKILLLCEQTRFLWLCPAKNLFSKPMFHVKQKMRRLVLGASLYLSM